MVLRHERSIALKDGVFEYTIESVNWPNLKVTRRLCTFTNKDNEKANYDIVEYENGGKQIEWSKCDNEDLRKRLIECIDNYKLK